MKEIRDWLEIAYFVSGPFVATAAIIAYRQLKVAKDTLTLNSVRDATKLAAEQCRHYMNIIIPKIESFRAEVKRLKITRYDNIQFEIKGQQVTTAFALPSIEEARQIAPFQLPVLNELEVFSIFFTSRVADEYVAYLTVGKTFCGTVQDLLPDIAYHNTAGHHKNITQLFVLWQPRLEAEKLKREQQVLQEKVKNNSAAPPVPPLGKS
jgi:hypothetical protein